MTRDELDDLIGERFRVQIADGYAGYRVQAVLANPEGDLVRDAGGGALHAQPHQLADGLAYIVHDPIDQFDDYVGHFGTGCWIDACTIAMHVEMGRRLDRMFGGS